MSLLVCCTALRVTYEVSADSPATSPLHPQDLAQGGPADLQLVCGGLARADQALELVPRQTQDFRRPGAVVALPPGEHLDRQADRCQRQCSTVEGPWTLDQFL